MLDTVSKFCQQSGMGWFFLSIKGSFDSKGLFAVISAVFVKRRNFAICFGFLLRYYE